jgi:hypothetical protein
MKLWRSRPSDRRRCKSPPEAQIRDDHADTLTAARAADQAVVTIVLVAERAGPSVEALADPDASGIERARIAEFFDRGSRLHPAGGAERNAGSCAALAEYRPPLGRRHGVDRHGLRRRGARQVVPKPIAASVSGASIEAVLEGVRR